MTQVIKYSANRDSNAIFITVVVPVFNEQEVLPEFHSRLMAVLASIAKPCEILYVDDGSKDQTWSVLVNFFNHNKQVSLIGLSRNFGKEIAITAGLDHAKGEAVILIDADLQDPPELIPVFIKEWQNGYDVVYGQYTKRHGESWLKKSSAYLFYRMIQYTTAIELPKDASDFRLLSQRAVLALKSLKEQHRFMKGLFAWVGYPQKGIVYQRFPRYAGTTKWNYWKLWNFALEGITSFTIAPLKFATYFGLCTAFGAFIYAIITAFKTILYGNEVQGYTSVMVVILFLGGVQLITLGVIGEYLGRMFNETKNRPLYLVREYLFDPSNSKLVNSHESAS